MPDRFTDEELRAIVGCSWRLDNERVPAPLIEVQRAVHDKARTALRAPARASDRCVCGHGRLQHVPGCLGFMPDRQGGRSAHCGCERYVGGYAVRDPDGGEHREEEERGPQGRQDQAERAQGHREGEGEAGGAALTEANCQVVLLSGEACCGLPEDCQGPRGARL